MPVAIVYNAENVTPRIFSETTEDLLVQRLRSLVDADDLKTVEDAQLWLSSLPSPSGWFTSAEVAKAHLKRITSEKNAPPSGAWVKDQRLRLGLTRAQFAERIGIGGNDNTRHKAVYEIEIGKRPLNPDRTRALRALVAEDALV